MEADGIDEVTGSKAISEIPYSNLDSLIRTPTKAGSQQDELYTITPKPVTLVKQKNKKAQVGNGKPKGVQGLVASCKMTPRMRKVRYAM